MFFFAAVFFLLLFTATDRLFTVFDLCFPMDALALREELGEAIRCAKSTSSRARDAGTPALAAVSSTDGNGLVMRTCFDMVVSFTVPLHETIRPYAGTCYRTDAPALCNPLFCGDEVCTSWRRQSILCLNSINT
jgi:hypothetical protein